MAQELTFSSWDELISANDSAYAGNNERVLKQTQDINLNSEYPLGVSLALKWNTSGSYSDVRSITIDGQGHKIINLRTKINAPESIFVSISGTGHYTRRTLIFKNIDFVNCILSGAHLYGGGTDEALVTLIFENCRFVGQRTGNAFLLNQNVKVTFTSCYFDMPWLAPNSTTYDYTSLIPKLTAVTNDRVTSYYCRFKEAYGGWVVPQGNSNPKYLLSCSYMDLHGCRIEGSMKADYSRTNGPETYVDLYVLSPYNDYEASTPNVVDMYWDIVYVSTPSYFYMPKIAGVFNKNTSKVSYYGWGTSSADSAHHRPSPIGATPDEMKNATWLSNQGFPIVVPSSN